MTLEHVKAELDFHFKHIDAILPIIKAYLPLSVVDFTDVEKVTTIDSFVLRFAKIQDKMGDKLFPTVLAEVGEYKSNMSLLDVLHRLEKLELIASTDLWLDFRKLRNSLTHEYPNNRAEIVQAIGLSITAYQTMKDIYTSMTMK